MEGISQMVLEKLTFIKQSARKTCASTVAVETANRILAYARVFAKPASALIEIC